MIKFKCDKCGLCCSNLHKSSYYSDLDRGDGVCKYFDESIKLCRIYAFRPLKCNILEYYNKHYINVLNLNDFYRINKEVCNKLKNGEKDVFKNI